MLGYEFSIKFKKGVDNRVAYALSRVDFSYESGSLFVISLHTPTSLEELKQTYAFDDVAHQQPKSLQSGLPSTSTFSLRHGLLFKKGRIYVPNSHELKAKILDFIHASPNAGHSGFQKSL